MDGDPLKVLGMLSGSYNSNFELSSDRELYFYRYLLFARLVGPRTDVVFIFEAQA